jgi:hypothetical protein
VEQEEGEEGKEEKTDFVFIDGKVLFVSASTYFPF